jgi:signal-transduction protein with cAMP-binding, CBS, and nucleotidyltransferase domain
MSRPARTIYRNDFLYHAIARMRRWRLRHMPVVDDAEQPVGILHLDDALAVAASQMVEHIERLTHEDSLDGMKSTKAAQREVAAALAADTVPAPDIQALLSHINRDLHRRVVGLSVAAMRDDGWGEPPTEFDVVILGSGGRGESYLNPDQDNGFVIADYPDSDHTRIDAWFLELAERTTAALNDLGFPLCNGYVMATNPMWRKTISQWKDQLRYWIAKAHGNYLRYCDIFFDFESVYGRGALTANLRAFVTENARRKFFLREMFKVDEAHGVALGFFGRLKTDPLPGPHQGKVNLKLTGTLPLVGAMRILALREGVPETATRARIDRLAGEGVLSYDEQDYLRGAFRHITNLLLRQQLQDAQSGVAVSNHVPPSALSEREKDILVDAFKAIRAFRSRVREELGAEVF